MLPEVWKFILQVPCYSLVCNHALTTYEGKKNKSGIDAGFLKPFIFFFFKKNLLLRFSFTLMSVYSTVANTFCSSTDHRMILASALFELTGISCLCCLWAKCLYKAHSTPAVCCWISSTLQLWNKFPKWISFVSLLMKLSPAATPTPFTFIYSFF